MAGGGGGLSLYCRYVQPPPHCTVERQLHHHHHHRGTDQHRAAQCHTTTETYYATASPPPSSAFTKLRSRAHRIRAERTADRVRETESLTRGRVRRRRRLGRPDTRTPSAPRRPSTRPHPPGAAPCVFTLYVVSPLSCAVRVTAGKTANPRWRSCTKYSKFSTQ